MNAGFNITALFIYPVKGLSGIALDKSFATSRGLKYDRRWMLVDEQHQFISQRNFTNLCLFKVEINRHGFIVTYNNKSIIIPFEINEGQKVKARIWEDEVDALKANDEINDFFCHHLQCKCSLVFMPESSLRQVDKNFVMHDQLVSFADGYPALMIGEESLNLLNSKLETPVEMNRFRPNIVFKGGIAHQEDLMIEFKIGDVVLKGVKACARCQVPGIEQTSGIVSKEPLKTLATYRNFNHKINFGQNVIILNEGYLAVGNEIILKN